MEYGGEEDPDLGRGVMSCTSSQVDSLPSPGKQEPSFISDEQVASCAVPGSVSPPLPPSSSWGSA